MKVRIDVKDRNEGDAITRALDDLEIRAYVVTTGILMDLPDDAARLRVLHCAEILLSSAPEGRARARGPLRLHDADTLLFSRYGREQADTGE
jgi:hypothetical protein